MHPLELELGPGETIGLLGPNGSGKSTLLRMLTGLVRPDGGAASIDGVALEGDGTAVRRRCTYAPGEIALYGEMDGGEHLDWLLRGRGSEARARARSIAGELGLPLRSRVRTYSHGMKRQVLFSAALAPRVGVRILDEASEGLDPAKRSVVLGLLAEDAARGTTILLSSHHLGEVDRACDRFVFLNQGRLVASESAEDVRRRASRLMRITFGSELGDGSGHARALRELDGLAGARARADGGSVTVELASDDPRPFLAALAARAGLPPPNAIEYGHGSLQDLFRDLYGVEAC